MPRYGLLIVAALLGTFGCDPIYSRSMTLRAPGRTALAPPSTSPASPDAVLQIDCYARELGFTELPPAHAAGVGKGRNLDRRVYTHKYLYNQRRGIYNTLILIVEPRDDALETELRESIVDHPTQKFRQVFSGIRQILEKAPHEEVNADSN